MPLRQAKPERRASMQQDVRARAFARTLPASDVAHAGAEAQTRVHRVCGPSGSGGRDVSLTSPYCADSFRHGRCSSTGARALGRRVCRKGVSEVVTRVEMGHDRGHPRADLRAATLEGVKRRPNSRNHWRLLPSARRESCGAISACSGSFSRPWDRSSARAGCLAPCMPPHSPGRPPSSPGCSEAAW